MNFTQGELMAKTKDQLMEICDDNEITYKSKVTKTELVDLILESDNDRDNDCSTDFDDENTVTINANLVSSIDGDGDPVNTVFVSCGIKGENFEVVGWTVGEVIALIQDRFNIEPGSVPRVYSNVVSNTYILKTGDTLEFTKKSGSKG